MTGIPAGETPRAIVVEELTKKFGDFVADDAISFHVDEEEIFGLLGPNGAGKSTLIRMLTTLLPPTSGRALVNGQDVARHTAEVRQSIGVIPQASTVDGDLSAWENMMIYGKFYLIPKSLRESRARELLEYVGLTEWKDRQAGTYSGGMRRRLEIARGLIHRPRVLFLDEPTTGLDPQSRRMIWELLEDLRRRDHLTILLCTHYMDEADRLCDRLAIVDHGKIAALGTPAHLKATVPGQDILNVYYYHEVEPALVDALKALPGVSSAATEGPHEVRMILETEEVPLEAILEVSRRSGNRLRLTSLEEPTLEDVFLHYTGRALRDSVAQEYVWQQPALMK